MSLSITRNTDGSVTVACGADTVTLNNFATEAAAPAPSPPPPPPPPSPPPPDYRTFPKPGASPTGVSAFVIGGEEPSDIDFTPVTTTDEIEALVRALTLARSHLAAAVRPPVLKIKWTSDEPLDLSDISDVVSGLDELPTLNFDIYIKNPRG
jgi:hypothetical protein